VPFSKIDYPEFDCTINKDGSICFKELEAFCKNGDIFNLDIEFDYDLKSQILATIHIKDILNDCKKEMIDIDIEPPFDDKTDFYDGYLHLSYTVSCFNIEKHLLKPTTAEFKQNFSDSLILYLRNLIADLDEYEHSHEYDKANYWVTHTARNYLLRLLAFICQKFNGYCRHNLKHHAQWEHELYPGKAVALKKFISKFEPETKKETVKAPDKKDPVRVDGFSLKSNADALLNALTALHLKIPKGLVDEAYSSIQDLHTLLTATDISNGIKPVRFKCETTQLAYILRRIKDSFDNLNDQSIEASGLFLTASGNKLSVSNIKKSLSDCKNNPKERTEIDTALAEFISKKQ